MLNYIFVDESGDPGKPYEFDSLGSKISTGASLFYILVALPLNSKELFVLQNRMLDIKNKFGYKKEIKSRDVSLSLYKELLKIINELDLKVFFRCINKEKYKGKFAVDGHRKLHNVFDEYNLAKIISFAVKNRDFLETDVVIDRAERRLLDGEFDNFNEYLIKKINTKTIKRVKYITHINSEYVDIMQMVDLICGAIKDNFTGRNTELKKIINKNLLVKIW